MDPNVQQSQDLDQGSRQPDFDFDSRDGDNASCTDPGDSVDLVPHAQADDQHDFSPESYGTHVGETQFSQLEAASMNVDALPDIAGENHHRDALQQPDGNHDSSMQILHNEPNIQGSGVENDEQLKAETGTVRNIEPAPILHDHQSAPKATYSQDRLTLEAGPLLVPRSDTDSIENIGYAFKFEKANHMPRKMGTNRVDSRSKLSSHVQPDNSEPRKSLEDKVRSTTGQCQQPLNQALTNTSGDTMAIPVTADPKPCIDARPSSTAASALVASIPLLSAKESDEVPVLQSPNTSRPMQDAEAADRIPHHRTSMRAPSFIRNARGCPMPLWNGTTMKKSPPMQKRNMDSCDQEPPSMAQQKPAQTMQSNHKPLQLHTETPDTHPIQNTFPPAGSHFGMHAEERTTNIMPFGASTMVSPPANDLEPQGQTLLDNQPAQPTNEQLLPQLQGNEYIASSGPVQKAAPVDALPAQVESQSNAAFGRVLSPISRVGSRSSRRSQTPMQRPLRPSSAHSQRQHTPNHSSKVIKQKQASATRRSNVIDDRQRPIGKLLGALIPQAQQLEDENIESGAIITQLEQEKRELYRKLEKVKQLGANYRVHMNGVVESQKVLQSEYDKSRQNRDALRVEVKDLMALVASKESELEKRESEMTKAKKTAAAQVKTIVDTQEKQLNQVTDRLQKEIAAKEALAEERTRLLMEVSKTRYLAENFEKYLQGIEPRHTAVMELLRQIQSNMTESATVEQNTLLGFQESTNSTRARVEELSKLLCDLKEQGQAASPAVIELMKDVSARIEAKLEALGTGTLHEAKANLVHDFKATLEQFRADNQTCTQLATHVNDLRTENSTLSSTSNDQQAGLTQLATEVKELKQELSKCQVELTAKTNELNRIENLPQEDPEVTEKLQEAEQTNRSLQEELSKAMQQASRVGEESRNFQETANAARERAQALEREVNEAKTLAKNLEEEKKTTIANCKKANERVRQESAKAGAAKKAEAKKEALTEVGSKLKSLEEYNKSLEEKCTKWEAHLRRARDDLKKSQQESAHHANNNNILQTELNAYKDQITQQSIRLDQFALDLVSPELVEERTRELSTVITRINEIQEMVDRVHGESSNNLTNFSHAHAQLERQVRDVGDLIRQKTSMEQQYNGRSQIPRKDALETYANGYKDVPDRADYFNDFRRNASDTSQTTAHSISTLSSATFAPSSTSSYEEHTCKTALEHTKVSWAPSVSDNQAHSSQKSQRKVANRNVSRVGQSSQGSHTNPTKLPTSDRQLRSSSLPQTQAGRTKVSQTPLHDRQTSGIRPFSDMHNGYRPLSRLGPGEEPMTDSPRGNSSHPGPDSPRPSPLSTTNLAELSNGFPIGGNVDNIFSSYPTDDNIASPVARGTSASKQLSISDKHREPTYLKSAMKHSTPASRISQTPPPVLNTPPQKGKPRQPLQNSRYNRTVSADIGHDLMASPNVHQQTINGSQHGEPRMHTPPRNFRKRLGVSITQDSQGAPASKKSRMSLPLRSSREIPDSQEFKPPA